ncbi:3'-5' exonuclease domain-containing protein [Caenorhabditis elegans]|uniref:3'-5' exonuclease domain-containing protein n=1 Tax=Caenorhabditis elegans TaxID=6239 RepID=Q21251_CAEEL|nr:3'-5' exonuclease domain-containing protein [Caenorhabditis elegans]CCD72690.1 3'-5' exonuclease domain-containing protein [Caenorhabditis elegans]|eukprot:NP_510676.1 Uncharacterized protein CELE_K05G3.1 [Caenorhabditis elegans]
MQRLNEFINLAKEQVSQGVNERRTSIMERIVEETEDFNKPAEFENLTITVTEDKEKAKRVLEKFEKHPTVPIYFDSEHSYIRLKNDTKVAAIQLYDSCTRHVLVWRLHNADHEYLKGVREQLELLSKARMFATFGKEEFLENAIKYVTKDLQVNQKSLEALLLKKEIVITKWETFSDWTRPVLRPSQERYAVYDVIRLFDLDQ